MTYFQKEQQAGREINQADVAASFQAAVIDVQVDKARTALRQTGAKDSVWVVALLPTLSCVTPMRPCAIGSAFAFTMPPLSACTGICCHDRPGGALIVISRAKFFGLDCDVKAHAPLDEAY